MSKLLWIVVQAAIVGLFLWFEHIDSASRRRPPDVGLALFYGMMVAVAVTFLVVQLQNTLAIRRGNATEARRGPDPPTDRAVGVASLYPERPDGDREARP